MKMNWKVVVAIILMIGAVAWTINWTRSTSYSGTHLTFEVGSGRVTITNPSNEPIPAKLINTSTRSFSVSSEIEAMPRTSSREGSTSLLAFDLPAGVSEFTVQRGSDISFIADTDTSLEATVQAANRSTKVQALIGFVIAVFIYIFFITDHQWLYTLLGREQHSKLHAEPYTGHHDDSLRAYGDNRQKR